MTERMSISECFFYVLLMHDGGYYTGITNSIERRLQEHMSGCSKSTRYRLPVIDCYYCKCKSRTVARMFEVIIKNTGAAKWLSRNGHKCSVVYGVTASNPVEISQQVTGKSHE